jgi:hypothetical protein
MSSKVLTPIASGPRNTRIEADLWQIKTRLAARQMRDEANFVSSRLAKVDPFLASSRLGKVDPFLASSRLGKVDPFLASSRLASARDVAEISYWWLKPIGWVSIKLVGD